MAMGVGGGFFGLSGFFRNLRRTSVDPTQTVGFPGFRVVGGFLEENEKNARLLGPARYVEFSDMLANTSIIGAGARYYFNLISRAGWNWEPADDSAAAKEFADIIDRATGEMLTSWARVVRRTARYRFDGFSVQEWTAQRSPKDSAVITLKDIAPRPAHTIEGWDIDDEGNVVGMIQRAPQSQQVIYLPRSKSVYAVDDTLSDSPIGLGLFRHLIEPRARLVHFELLESIAFDTNLRGIPVFRAPLSELESAVQAGTMTQSQAAAQVASFRRMAKDHARNPKMGLLIDSATYRDKGESAAPSGTSKWGVELVQGNQQGEQPMAAAIERINREMARILGVEGLLLGGEKVGSMALSKDKSQNFAVMVESALDEIAEIYDRDFVGQIFTLNGWPLAMAPKAKPEPVQFRDIEQVGAVLRDMAAAGAVLDDDDPVINAVRNLMSLPEAPERDLDEAIDASLRRNPPPPQPPDDQDVEEDEEVGET